MDAVRLLPIVDLVEHGERGSEVDPVHPSACLCGRYLDYIDCPDAGEIWGLTITAAPLRLVEP